MFNIFPVSFLVLHDRAPLSLSRETFLSKASLYALTEKIKGAWFDLGGSRSAHTLVCAVQRCVPKRIHLTMTVQFDRRPDGGGKSTQWNATNMI